MEKFDFVLVDDNKKAFNLFFWFLFFLHLAVAAYMVVNDQVKHSVLHQLRFITAYSVFIILLFWFKKTKYAFSISSPFLSLLYFGFWMAHDAYLPMAIILIVSAGAQYLQTKKNSVTVSSQEVIIKGILTEKKYNWKDIDNLVFKDTLLSIDLKSNKLFQFDIVTNNIDESLFNQFCVKQLAGNQ